MEILTCALRLILLYTVTVYAKEKKVNPTAKGMLAHQFLLSYAAVLNVAFCLCRIEYI